MITREESKAILKQVRANLAKLDGCPGPHDLVPHERFKPGSPIVRNHRCTLCGGVMDMAYIHWYQQGLKHGREGR